MFREISYTARPEDEGRLVRDILKTAFGLVAHDISRAKYRKDGIRLNGERVYVTEPLKNGDVLTVRLEDEAPKNTVPAEGPLDILYEDEDMIVLNKPAGIVVHPSHGHYKDSLGNFLAGYFEKKGECHDIRTIGRLDKDTSGVILYGKTRSAVYLMNRQNEEGLHFKTYLALAEGHFEEKCGRFDGPIGRVPNTKLLREVRDDGDEAHTFYEVLCEDEAVSLVKVRITTGRTHQIRVHFSHAGHPLLGDPLYGGSQNRMMRAALHCYESTFKTVFTDKTVTLKAPVPDDMAACLPEGAARLI